MDYKKCWIKKDLGKECQNTPLVLALKKNMGDIALLLIESGADTNITCRNNDTALHWACMLRKNDIIHSLIEHGAEINKVNRFGRTPYEYYCYQVSLIDINNPIDAHGVEKVCRANMHELSDLYFHTAENNRDYISTILQGRIKARNEAQIDSQIVGCTCVTGTANLSLQQQHKAIVEDQYTQIKNKAARYNSVICLPADGRDMAQSLNNIVEEIEVEMENDRFKEAPLSKSVKNRDKETIQKFLDSGAEVNAQSTDGFTALHWAAMRRDRDTIVRLIAKGAKSDIKNKYGRTSLEYYTYQIRAKDFEGCISQEMYQNLVKYNKDLASGESEMPEFKEIYWNEPMIDIGAGRRNSNPVDLTIFSTNSNSTKIEMQPLEHQLMISQDQSVNQPPKVERKNQITSNFPKNQSIKQNTESTLFLSQAKTVKTLTAPLELQAALKDSSYLRNCLTNGYVSLERLIDLHKNFPYVIGALRCSNIYNGIHGNFITIEQLSQLTEKQVCAIEHEFKDEELGSEVQRYLGQSTYKTYELD